MIDIVYCGNYAVYDLISLSILSMIDKTDEVLNIHILTMDMTFDSPTFKEIDDISISKLNNLVKTKNINSSVCKIDVLNDYLKTFKDSPNHNTVYTPYSMLRLFIPNYSCFSGKVIYLDTDTMIYNDIKELYDIDVTNHEYAASKDHMGKFFINKNYINSGVLLLNIDMIRETNFFDKVIHLMLTKKMSFPDQTALNTLATNKLIIDSKFNHQRKVYNNTVVKHFCKGIKWFPLFKIYNIKQNNIDKVQNFLKINEFNNIYIKYNQLKKENKL